MARILVVDDEKSIRLILREFLLEENHTVETAANVEDAKALLKTNTFDVVICDIILPKIPGIEFLRFIQSKTPEVRVIMFTGEPTVETAAEAVRAGAYDYLCKPIQRAAIHKIVKAAAREKALHDETVQLQRENQQHQKRLEALVADLQNANEDLKAFGYSVSHDLRAPLRAIDSFSDILLQNHLHELSHNAQHLLKQVNNSSQYMKRLLEALLSLSRLGQRTLSKQKLSPLVMVEQIIETLPNHNTQWILDPLPHCHADSDLLKQVYVNLLSNALKFSKQNPKPSIHIGCQQKEQQLIYFVKDNGVGFNMHYAEKLFQVFQRLHSADNFEGTGVGLCIVQRIIERHGGKIWAEAKENQGASFFFTLASP